MGIVFTITWIIKYAILRIFGRKVYDNVVVPGVFGYIAGYIIAVILSAIILMIRYFFPY
jgi:uncharacterized MnhB-related membrane protein